MGELTKLGRYQLRKVLGRGAMGVVYEGLDPSLNRRVAVKTILKNAAIDAETAEMYSAQFGREAQAAGRLNHPHIVQVHDFAEEGEVAYLVMEYIQGRELRSFFEAKEKFEVAEAVRIMGELLDALDFAHEAGVIHRDVKPANVMLDSQRRVKLADFGVARIQDSERSAAGTMVGTPAFMSPEQIQGMKIDRRTDIFSAGTILYQLLTGEQPFTGAGAWTVAKKIMQDDPPQPSSMVKSVSPVFDAIVSKALAKKASDRFASAREFAVSLRAALGPGGQPSAMLSMPPTPAPRAKSGTPAASPASEAEVEFWKAIQNSTDPAEFEFYLEQFPDGTYAGLARHKITRLSNAPAANAESTLRLAAEAEAKRREAEAQEQAAAQARAEEQAKRAAQLKAEALAEAAARARKEAEEKAKREAAEKARREAETRARVEAELKAHNEAQERARQAAALAKLKQQEAARAAADPEATVAISRPAARAPLAAAAPPQAPKKSFVVPAIIGAVVVIGGAAAFFAMKGKPEPAPVAQAPAPVVAPPAPAVAAAPVVDEAKIRREVEERVRREYADKSAAEQAAAAKAASEKAIQEKQLAAKSALIDKAAAEKLATEKAASEKALQEKLAAAKSAGEKAALEKASAEKAVAEKSAARPAPPIARGSLPAIGDRWTYEFTELRHGGAPRQMTVQFAGASGGAVTESIQRSNGAATNLVQRAGAVLVGLGGGHVNFAPLDVRQELRAGQEWRNLELRNVGVCSSDPGITCNAYAQVVGREQVIVKAGTFNAWKVAVVIDMKQNVRGTVEFTYWYADEVKRFVKYQSRGRYLRWQEPDLDMQLVSYAPAGAGPVAKQEAGAKSEPPKSESPAAPAQVASVAPAPAAAARKPGWPSVGDRFVYETREVNRDRRGNVAVEVLAVSASGIQDSYRESGGTNLTYQHKPGAYVVGGGLGIALFSPYLRPLQDLRVGQSWSDVPFDRLGGCSSDPQVICSLSAKVIGREKLSVKAGSYDAWKVELEFRVKTGGPSRFYEVTLWYAEELGRMVKYQLRQRSSGIGLNPDTDMELVSFTPAGKN